MTPRRTPDEIVQALEDDGILRIVDDEPIWHPKRRCDVCTKSPAARRSLDDDRIHAWLCANHLDWSPDEMAPCLVCGEPKPDSAQCANPECLLGPNGDGIGPEAEADRAERYGETLSGRVIWP